MSRSEPLTPQQGVESDSAPILKGDGESWEDYAHRLERRIKAQRDQLEEVQKRMDEPTRRARSRIAALERAVGIKALKMQNLYDGLEAVKVERDGLEEQLEAAQKTLHKIRMAVARGQTGGGELNTDLPAVPEPDWDEACDQYLRDQGEVPSPATESAVVRGADMSGPSGVPVADSVPASDSEDLAFSREYGLDTGDPRASGPASEPGAS